MRAYTAFIVWKSPMSIRNTPQRSTCCNPEPAASRMVCTFFRHCSVCCSTSAAIVPVSHDAVVVFGADWCHDSRALGEVLSSDAFKTEFGGRYEVTFIDVGRPQTGEGRNLELVKRLGVKNLKSTPAMFVLRGDGKVLNGKKDALSWRNAESRGPDKILAWFRDFKKS